MSAVSCDEQSPLSEEGVYGYEKDVIVSPMNDEAMPMSATNSGGSHQCPVCFKVFVSSKGLVQHSIIHTDRKPFKCEQCSKAFRFKSNLFEHRSIHTGEQPFVCPYCGKACRLKGNLKKHLKTHVKEPQEIEHAYESVTAAHSASMNSQFSSSSSRIEYAEESDDYDSASASRTPRARRKTVLPKKLHKTASMLVKPTDDENNEPDGTRPLMEMFDASISWDHFIKAARAIPFGRYHCRPCQQSFPSRGDMEEHCEKEHGINRRSQSSNPVHWCGVCLRHFDDQISQEQHSFFHRRIRALISKGELHIQEPKLQSYW